MLRELRVPSNFSGPGWYSSQRRQLVAAAHFWGHKDLREFDALPVATKAEMLQFYLEEIGKKNWESYQQYLKSRPKKK